MTIRILEGLRDGERPCAALIDGCTGIALPCHTFDTTEDADRFLAWAGDRAGRSLTKLHKATLFGLWEQWLEEQRTLQATVKGATS